MGRPAFPFIGQGKDLGYTRERTEKGIPPGLCRPSPLWAGPAGPVVDYEGVCILWLRLSLVLQVGVAVFGHGSLSVTGPIGRRRHLAAALHPFLACGMVDKSPVWSCMGIEQHSVGPPDTVGDVSA
jgi:hypothetical protein